MTFGASELTSGWWEVTSGWSEPTSGRWEVTFEGSELTCGWWEVTSECSELTSGANDPALETPVTFSGAAPSISIRQRDLWGDDATNEIGLLGTSGTSSEGGRHAPRIGLAAKLRAPARLDRQPGAERAFVRHPPGLRQVI